MSALRAALLLAKCLPVDIDLSCCFVGAFQTLLLVEIPSDVYLDRGFSRHHHQQHRLAQFFEVIFMQELFCNDSLNFGVYRHVVRLSYAAVHTHNYYMTEHHGY